MKISGQCYCGEIAYEGDIDPEKVGICHCSDCQALSGSAFRTVGMAAGETFRIVRGEPKKYVKIADSGNRRVQAFCGTCGSALYASDDSENPAVYAMRLGTVNQRADLTPRFEIWRHSALPWMKDFDDTAKFDGNPG